jgi:hypothetical protein
MTVEEMGAGGREFTGSSFIGSIGPDDPPAHRQGPHFLRGDVFRDLGLPRLLVTGGTFPDKRVRTVVLP